VIFIFLENEVVFCKGSCANKGTKASEKTKREVIYLSGCPQRNGRKHLTAIATSWFSSITKKGNE
jgi:hypothetical protein